MADVMLCLKCGGAMELRELHPVYEGGGILFRLEAAALGYACADCRLLSPANPPAPAAPVDPPAAPATQASDTLAAAAG